MRDCIILGIGGIGSASAYFAAKFGWNVLGIEQFGAAHNMGSSHGQTRMIRTAYFEHPNYVPLTHQAFDYWDEIQKTSTETLIRRTGLLQIGHPDGPVVKGVLKSAKDHDLQVDTLDKDQISQKYPLFKPDSEHIGVYEQKAGFLRVEKCVATLIKLAKAAGADFSFNTHVAGWEANDDGSFTVTTSNGTFDTKRLIVTAGAWTSQLLGHLNLKLKIVRKQQQWFQSDRIDGHVENGFPCFLVETRQKDWFYGLPAIDRLGMKVAEHTGGQVVDDPADLDRELNDADAERAKDFVAEYLDFGFSRVIYSSACMYTFSPDEHFILDQHPNHPNLVFAAGLSGHGFKFAPVLGEYLVDLLDGKSSEQFEFFKLSRF